MNINTMQQFKDKLEGFITHHSLHIDRYYTILLWLVVILTLSGILQLLHKPVTATQKQDMQHYTAQHLYPYTQSLAVDLLEQSEPISQYQYFRFLRVLHFEKQRIHFQKEDES